MYVKIVDKGECFSTTMEYINGVYANKSEWAKYNFYPQNGMVGEVVAARSHDIFIIKIKEGIYVPMTRRGIQEISYNEYIASQDNNVCNGMDERQKRINDGVDYVLSSLGCSWQQLPNLRMHFRQDIIGNIQKLTCDYSRNIYIYDLEESAVIYALDMCLEYQAQSYRTIDPMTAQDIANQVGDVYMELFIGQFSQVNKNSVIQRVLDLCWDTNARTMVDSYYEKVNNRYDRSY